MGFSFQGTVFKAGLASDALLEVGCLTGYSETQNAPTKIDDTCAATTGNKKFIIGLGENSQVTIDLSLDHDNTGYLLLVAAKKSGDLVYLQIDYNDNVNTSMTGTGYVFGVSKSGAVDDKFTASISIEMLTDFE